MRAGALSRSSFSLLALALLAACSGGDGNTAARKPSSAPDREWNDPARVEAIASTLQACSYGGGTEKVQANALGGAAPGDCRDMVDRIMGFTGLPANFIVTSGPVQNALAVILLDNQRQPKRVIAFNPQFIRQSERETGGDPWAPVSIMAHEIGHHLSGHTITAGGSRPEIELEADKFSGYVLYRMGASADAATKAIMALVSPQASSTHPGRDQRAQAIRDGWLEACRQSRAGNCSAGTAATPPIAGTPGSAATLPAMTAALPAPSTSTVPFKYGRFVVDETGKLDAAELAKLDRELRDIAAKQGTEFAFLVVNDLHGMRPDDYAWTMLRQLRIGKLDLGNGGVIVVAPDSGQVGHAFAPGVAKLLEAYDANRQTSWADLWRQRGCANTPPPDAQGCAGLASLMLPSSLILNWLREVTFRVRYDNIEDVIADADKRRSERKAGRDPDQTLGQHLGALTRFSGTVTQLDAKPEFNKVNAAIVKRGWRAIVVKTAEGRETTLYMQPETARIMPSGALQLGKNYTFTGELNSSGQFTTDQGVIQGNPSIWLFSYERLD